MAKASQVCARIFSVTAACRDSVVDAGGRRPGLEARADDIQQRWTVETSGFSMFIKHLGLSCLFVVSLLIYVFSGLPWFVMVV